METCRTREKALVPVVQEAEIHRISMPAVNDQVQAMDGTGVSRSAVSRLCREIDERVQAFLNRPLESNWPIVWLDATQVKARRNQLIVPFPVIMAAGGATWMVERTSSAWKPTCRDSQSALEA